jgi:hypothetical protein
MWQTFHFNLPLSLQTVSASSVTWRCVVGWVIPDVSKHCSIFQTLNRSPNDTMSHPRRHESSAALLWEPQVVQLQRNLCPCHFISNNMKWCKHCSMTRAVSILRPSRSIVYFPTCCFSLLHVWKTKFYVTVIPCVLQPKPSAGPLLATHLTKPLFRMIYLDAMKQWKVRSFVKLFTFLMYS